jgi:hypothetical protein
MQTAIHSNAEGRKKKDDQFCVKKTREYKLKKGPLIITVGRILVGPQHGIENVRTTDPPVAVVTRNSKPPEEGRRPRGLIHLL